MAKIFPFHAYRFTEKAGPIETLVTQPYDKISPEMRARYLALNPYNLVRVVLGERYPADSPADNVYTRAAALLDQWIAAGILARDAVPSLFAYFQEFSSPDTGERLLRKGFIGLGALEEYSAGIVYRHEQTLSGPKQDRMELLRHLRAQAEQIFMLYPDPEGDIDAILDQVAAASAPIEVTDEYDAVHRLWPIADPALTARIQALMGEKKLLIADGHHRYETALAFHNANPQQESAAVMPMAFFNMHSDGLRILATHRVVHSLEQFDVETFLTAARRSFTVSALGSIDELRAAWKEEHAGRTRIGLAVPGGVYLLEKARVENALDVLTLHREVLEDLLGMSEADIREQRYLRYVRGLEPAAARAQGGGAQAAFLLEAVPVSEVARIAFAGGVMPQKSTDFYPKLLSGMALYKM